MQANSGPRFAFTTRPCIDLMSIQWKHPEGCEQIDKRDQARTYSRAAVSYDSTSSSLEQARQISEAASSSIKRLPRCSILELRQIHDPHGAVSRTRPPSLGYLCRHGTTAGGMRESIKTRTTHAQVYGRLCDRLVGLSEPQHTPCLAAHAP